MSVTYSWEGETRLGREIYLCYLVDEAILDGGEAERLVELVQRLHLVHRDCKSSARIQKATSSIFTFSSVTEPEEYYYQEAGAENACSHEVWAARTAGSSYPGARLTLGRLFDDEDDDDTPPILCAGTVRPLGPLCPLHAPSMK
jgi:hypothetical protein